MRAITIDSPATRDRDDAVWATRDVRGWTLTVCIANVAAAIPIGSPFDLSAGSRIKTKEIGGMMQPMLPRRFSENMCSLNEGCERSVISLHVRFDHDFVVESTHLDEATLVSEKQMTYDEALHALSDASDPYHHVIFDLATLAEGIAKKRGIPFAARSARRIIQELMTLANRQLAKYSLDKNIPVLFCHRSLAYEIAPDDEPYVHGTSPIRRYVDLVNQRQWRAHLHGKPFPYEHVWLEAFSRATNHEVARSPGPDQRWDRGQFSKTFRRAIRSDVVNHSIATFFHAFVGELTVDDLHAAMFDSASSWGKVRHCAIDRVKDEPHLAMSILSIAQQKSGWPKPKVHMQKTGGPNGMIHRATVSVSKPDWYSGIADAHTAKLAKQIAAFRLLRHAFDQRELFDA